MGLVICSLRVVKVHKDENDTYGEYRNYEESSVLYER